MPTTSNVIRSSPSPKLIFCPTGLSPGQWRRAIVSLTRMTGVVSSRSACEKRRPSRSGMFIAPK
jgi:hypothetical protein